MDAFVAAEAVDNVTVSTFSVYDKMHFYAGRDRLEQALWLRRVGGLRQVRLCDPTPHTVRHARTVLALKVLVIATQDDWPAPQRDGKPEGKIDFAGEAASANVKAQGFLTWKKSAAECPGRVGRLALLRERHERERHRPRGTANGFTSPWCRPIAPRAAIVWDPEIGAVMSRPASPPTASGIGAAGIVGITVSSLAVLGLALNPSVHRKARAVARSSVGRLTGAGTEATPATNYARHDDDV